MEKLEKYNGLLFSALFNKSDDIIILINKNGDVLLANDKLFDYELLEIKDRGNPGKITDIFNKSEKKMLAEKIKNTFAKKEECPFKLSHRISTEQTTYFDCTLNMLDIDTCFVRLKDVTQQVQQKLDLRELEEYRTYFRQNSNLLLIIIDEKGKIKGWNKGAEIVLGYAKEETLGSDKIWKTLFRDREDRKRALHIFLDGSLHAANDEIFKLRSKDKSEKTINFFKQRLSREDGTHLDTIILGIDITEKCKTEANLFESEKKYRQLVNLLPEVIFEVDHKGKILFVNDQAFSIFGYQKQDFENGLNVMQMIAPEDIPRAKDNFNKFLKGETSGKGNEYMVITRDGKKFPVLIYNELVMDKKKPVGIRGIIIDISKRKNYENFLKMAKEKAEESDRLKSTFLANMSHEIRTPMNGIMGFAELLKDPNLAYHERRQFLDIITNSGNHLLNLINDIIDLSKIEAGQLIIDKEEFSLNALLNDVHSFFQTEIETKEQDLKLILNNDLPDDKSWVYTDSVRLRQILNNLVGNAVKFTKSGRIEFGYQLKNGFIEFFVKDTGIGLNEEQMKIVFERFAQAENQIERKYGGTGLGLAICKGVADLMGGNIWLNSQEGKGSQFYFNIPYTPTTVTIEEFNNEELIQDVDWSNKRILIAEDDDASFELLKALLARTKVKVVRVKNGLEVVEAYKQDHGFDLVLMDIQLPRLNGIEATKQLKNIDKSLPVIAQTANAMTQHKRDCLKAGCDDYLTKPLDFKTLIMKLKTHLS